MQSNIKFKQFNLICENLEAQLILEAKNKSLFSFFSKRWGLEDELEILLPFIKSKINSVFSNIYETGKPGEINLEDEPSIEPIDVGTDNPGFELKWQLDSSYVQDNLFPIIFEKPDSRFSKLTKQYKLSPDNVEFVIRINADNPKADLSKPEVQIKKLSIPNWNGDIYLNFEIPEIDRSKSNVKIGTIKLNVTVEEYQSLIVKLGDFMENFGNGVADDGGLFGAIGEGLANLFNKSSKKPKDDIDEIKRNGLENIPGAKIKCTVQFNDELKKDIELGGKKNHWDWDLDDDDKTKWDPDFLYTDVVKDTDKIEEIMPLIDFEKNAVKFNKTDDTNIAYELTDDQTWTPAKRNGRFYSTELNKRVTNRTNGYVCCSFVSQVKQFSKNYYVYLDIDNWKAADFDNSFLIKKNPEPIYIQIEVIDNKTDNLLLERWYNIENFKKAEPEALRFILKSFQYIKPLS